MNSAIQIEKVSLSPSESALMAEYVSAAREIELQSRGALMAIIRLRGLEGQWTLSGNELIKGGV